MTIKNASPFDVSISEMSLIDHRGVYVGSQYATISALESGSAVLAKGYKDWIVGSAGSTAIATVGSSAAAQVAISTGSMIPIYGLSYLATLPQILLPYLAAKDREAVEAEFHRRQLPSPLKLSAGASITGSVFFPIVPQPKALVIREITEHGKHTHSLLGAPSAEPSFFIIFFLTSRILMEEYKLIFQE